MFGIGAGELIMLMALALIIVGPQKLPELGRTAGKALAEFKAYTDDMRSVLTMEQPSSTAPTSHFPGIGGAQAYRGATEQVAAPQPPVAETAEPTSEPVALRSGPPTTPLKGYFSEEPALEPAGAAVKTGATI